MSSSPSFPSSSSSLASSLSSSVSSYGPAPRSRLSRVAELGPSAVFSKGRGRARGRARRPKGADGDAVAPAAAAPPYECGVGVEYVLCDGLRHVRPYHFAHSVYAKRRWYGRRVLDVFAAEFFHPSPSYYLTAMQLGLLTINGQPCTPLTTVASSDLIRHTLHRHEPPVTAQPCAVLHQDDSIVVINKPSSIPIHPCGKYWSETTLTHPPSPRLVGSSPPLTPFVCLAVTCFAF